MTFSRQAKIEIEKACTGLSGCCLKAFLFAVLKCLGEFEINKGGVCLVVESQSRDFLELLKNLVKSNFGHYTNIESETTLNFKKAELYTASFPLELAEKVGIASKDSQGALQLNDNFKETFASKPCCEKAFLQGLFLSCGSVVVPLVSENFSSIGAKRYHLEFVFKSEDLQTLALDILQKHGFNLKTAKRKSLFVLYTKNGETISDLLALLHATAAKLVVENVQVVKSVRNDANRQRNCIFANIEKQIKASEAQISAIEKLQKSGKISALPPNLLEVLKLRVENPEASLFELSEISGLSKSCLKHRLQKLVEKSTEDQ